MPEPKPRKWIYTVPIAGGEMEAELWTASTSRSEIIGDIACAHQLPIEKVKLRRAS